MKHPRQPTYLLVASLLVFAAITVSGQDADESAARLIDSFGRVPNGDMRGRTDVFLAELANNPGAKGIVYVHGTPAEIAGRTRYFQNQIRFRSFDASRIEFLKGRNIGDVRTDFWLVPVGAEPPEIKPEAWIAVEFGRVYKRDADRRFKLFFDEASNYVDHSQYVINYGTPSEIAMRERWITSFINFRSIHRARHTIVNGGPGPG